MARLLMGICSSYRIRQWYWIERLSYRSKIISINIRISPIIIKGESEICPNFWNRHNNYYWTWFFPPSRIGLLCYLPHFAPTASRKKQTAKNIIFLYQSAMRNTKGWIEITRGNFTRKPTKVNFPSADWLSYLRTQLTMFVCGVCLRKRKIFFSAVFSKQSFYQKGTLKRGTSQREFVRLLSNFDSCKQNLLPLHALIKIQAFSFICSTCHP